MVLPCPPCRVITKHEKLFLSSDLPIDQRPRPPSDPPQPLSSLIVNPGVSPPTAFTSVPALSPLHLPMSPVLNTVKTRL